MTINQLRNLARIYSVSRSFLEDRYAGDDRYSVLKTHTPEGRVSSECCILSRASIRRKSSPLVARVVYYQSGNIFRLTLYKPHGEDVCVQYDDDGTPFSIRVFDPLTQMMRRLL